MTSRTTRPLVAVLIRIGLLLALGILLLVEKSQAQQAAEVPATPAASLQTTQPVPGAPRPSPPAPLSEDELQHRYAGKLLFLRGSYLGNDLSFDKEGKINGSPAIGSFTVCAFQVRKITLSKKKLEIEADRYGLHFRGALPFEDEGNAYDQVKISDKPVHLTIEREPIVIPKAKKKTAAAPAGDPGAMAQAHSDQLMNQALENVFASDLDARMLAQLPSYWQGYFASKQQRRPFMPADASVKVLTDGMRPPRVLNAIDPASNEFAQQYGIAGMEMLRTVVDATGNPKEIAISRPIGFGLDERAVDAVKKSHFKPALVNGQPVPVIIDLVVTFRIYSNLTKPGSVAKDSTLAASMADSDVPR
jgi:TonB family protein